MSRFKKLTFVMRRLSHPQTFMHLCKCRGIHILFESYIDNESTRQCVLSNDLVPRRIVRLYTAYKIIDSVTVTNIFFVKGKKARLI